MPKQPIQYPHRHSPTTAVRVSGGRVQRQSNAAIPPSLNRPRSPPLVSSTRRKTLNGMTVGMDGSITSPPLEVPRAEDHFFSFFDSQRQRNEERRQAAIQKSLKVIQQQAMLQQTIQRLSGESKSRGGPPMTPRNLRVLPPMLKDRPRLIFLMREPSI